MDRPTIKGGCAAPAGMGSLLALWLVLVGCQLPLPPSPVPTPDPPPVVVTTGTHVLIVEETADRSKLSLPQLEIFTSAKFRVWCRDNKIALRVWDQNLDASAEPDRAFPSMLSAQRTTLPWIVIAGKKTISRPLPATLTETQVLIGGAQ